MDLLVKRRLTLSQDDRSKLIEHELTEIKLVISRYLLYTASWNKIHDQEKRKNFNWDTYCAILINL